MMSVKCAVPECSNVSGESKTFWPAPKQDAIRKQWFQVLGVPITLKSALICEDHFQVEDQDQNSDQDNEHSYSRPELEENGERKRRRDQETNHRTRSLAESNNDDHRSPYSATSSDDVENSQEQWRSGSSPTRDGSRSEDSEDSQALIIKSEPEDNDCHMEESAMDPPETHEELVSTYMLGTHVKVETDPLDVSLEADIRRPMETESTNGGTQTPLILSQPYLEILDQPESSYRFRYKRESTKPHGPLKGRSYSNRTSRNTSGPKVKLCNFNGKKAILRVWLFCGSEPSPHQLVSTAKLTLTIAPVKEELLIHEPHEIEVGEENDYTASFDKLNILHVVCGDVDYQKRYYYKKHFALSNSFHPPSNLPPFDPIHIKDEVKRKEKDIASLFIEAFEETDRGYRKLCDVISESIKNKKSPKTNDLRILKQSHEEGSCRGNQQVLIFTEKLIKDVCVEFFEEDEDGEITWCSKASFKDTDIHKQVAISFWTPPYKDLHITNPVPVFFRLVRATDGATSHNRTYMYLPADCPCGTTRVNAPTWPRKRECMTSSEVPKSEKGTQASLTYLVEVPRVIQSKVSPSGIKVPMPTERKQRKPSGKYHRVPMPIHSKYSTVGADIIAKLRVPHLVPVPTKKPRYSPPQSTCVQPPSS